MTMLRAIGLGLVGVILLVALPVSGAGAFSVVGNAPSTLALPDSEWWVVIHDQCNDTLHWINPSGEFAAIARPTLPDEAASSPCSARAMHISQNGRYLVESALLNSGRVGVGFYDLQTGNWLMVHQAQPGELVYLGDRYSSDAYNRIAIGFANDLTTIRAWRVIIFDMSTGNALEQLQSSGPEIASFVGGEFLASAATSPYVVLLAVNVGDGSPAVHIRFDALDGTSAPLGAAAWYPMGAPGVAQKLISSPYAKQDQDLLPDGRAVMAYDDAGYPAGPPVGEDALHLVTTNAIGIVSDAFASPQLFYADGTSTVYGPQWAADGRIALFRRGDGVGTSVYWNVVGTAVLQSLSGTVAQISGVPGGFVYSNADGLYYQRESGGAVVGPVVSGPMFSGSMALVWASAFGNPLLALDTPQAASSSMPIPTLAPVTTVLPIATVPGSGTALPDLFISEFSLDPATPIQGQPVEVRVGVYNQGGSTSTTFQIAWWPGENYASPACNWTLDGLVGTGGRILTCTYAGYPSPYSNLNTKVLADTTNAVAESNEVNNGYTQAIAVNAPAPVAQPDLYVSEFSLSPATPVQGQSVEVRVGVYNQGDAAVSGTFHIAWWPGENYPSPACDWDLDSLAAHGGRILTCTYAGYPSPYSSINTKVMVDTGSAISESNESNNGYTQPISVTAPAVPTSPPAGQPDLYVSEFSLSPAVPVKGQPVEVRVGVYNQGNAAVSGTFQIAWWPGENYPSPACNWSLDSLAAHGGRILTCTYAGYPSPYSSINTKVMVDTGNAISESNESNNTFTQSVRVTSP